MRLSFFSYNFLKINLRRLMFYSHNFSYKSYFSMRTIILLIAFLIAANATVIPRVEPVVTHVPRTYKVSLSDPPEVRWKQIIEDYKVPLAKFMEDFDKLPIPESFFNGVEWYAKNVFKHQDFVAEVDAISKLSGYPFEKMFFLNFMYEFSTFKACTGILVRNSAGKVFHGRNLDFEMWHLLSNLVTNVEYYQGDKKIFSVDTVVGSVFALTGIRHGAFAINVDTRKAKHFYDDLISIMKDDGIPTVWLLRRTLAEEPNYDRALKRLKYEKIGGPVYYILSGIGADEGSVIERDTESVHAIYELSETNWFLVQTNYDRDYPDPLHDPRRVPVEKRLRERGNANL